MGNLVWQFMGYRFMLEKVNLLKHFSQNSRGHVKNHFTNARLICTPLNSFFVLNTNMAMKIWMLKFFWRSLKIYALPVPDIGVERVKHVLVMSGLWGRCRCWITVLWNKREETWFNSICTCVIAQHYR